MSFLLLESGAKLLLESGGAMLLEDTAAVVAQTFRKALRAKLLSLPDLTAIVGAHVYPGAIPPSHDFERDGPAIAYLVSKFPGRTLTGHTLTGSDGTIQTLVNLIAEGYSFSDVDNISILLYEHLDGVVNAHDWGDGSIVIMSCMHGPEIDEPVEIVSGRPTIVYRIDCQFRIKYRPNPLPF